VRSSSAVPTAKNWSRLQTACVLKASSPCWARNNRCVLAAGHPAAPRAQPARKGRHAAARMNSRETATSTPRGERRSSKYGLAPLYRSCSAKRGDPLAPQAAIGRLRAKPDAEQTHARMPALHVPAAVPLLYREPARSGLLADGQRCVSPGLQPRKSAGDGQLA